MYIENRCRPRAATVKIRKHYLPVGHLSPLEGTAFAGANRRGEGVSLAVLPPFLCAVKEMGVNIKSNIKKDGFFIPDSRFQKTSVNK